jgi:hypothetical protein
MLPPLLADFNHLFDEKHIAHLVSVLVGKRTTTSLGCRQEVSMP